MSTPREFVRFAFAVSLLGWCCHAATAQEAGQLRLANLFNDGMVLQRDKPLTIWGRAAANAEVTVTLTEDEKEARQLAGDAALRRPPVKEKPSPTVEYRFPKAQPFEARTVKTKADGDGRWQASLEALPASFAPKFLVVTSGESRVAILDVLVGEVWLTSGQSNMAWGLNGDAEWALEKDSADYPAVRYSRVNSPSDDLKDDLTGRVRWISVKPGDDLGAVSGVSYYFAVRLHRYLKVPVGIHCNAVGGTLAEQWTGRDALEAVPELAKYLQDRKTSDCYNGMIAPVRRFTFRGALFFQGENNSIGKWTVYQHAFPRLIENWRKTFDDPNLPFGIISLYGFGPHGRDQEPELASLPQGTFWYAAIRDVHFRTFRTTPNTGLITTWDVGDTANIHPHRKGPVGERAARWALAKVYQQPIVHTAPLYREMKVEGNKVILSFDLDPLMEAELKKNPMKPTAWLHYPFTREGEAYRGFAVAGEDRSFHPAQVRRGKEPATLEVWSDYVAKPAAVRFGWSGMPDANVIGPDHLPLHPFRTDDWPLPEDPPYDSKSPERQTYDANLQKLRQQAQRELWRRKLFEARSLLGELERQKAQVADEASRDRLAEKIKQTRQLLEQLESDLAGK